MKQYIYRNLSRSELCSLTKRPFADDRSIMPLMQSILDDVRAGKDAALKRLTKQFDGIDVTEFRVCEKEFRDAQSRVKAETMKALITAAGNIRRFHELQFPRSIETETTPGVTCRKEWRAIQRVGLYVPGGTAPLISTVLMLGIPASIAGCDEVVLCTPPSKDGSIQAEILVAANLVGIKNVFKAGGAQAVAAMAVGTESIPCVDKIFGPGNRYVASMKSLVSQPPHNVAIDMTAGPTELLIIADANANAGWVAADLLSQAEHGKDSHVALVTNSKALADDVEYQLVNQLNTLPRKEFIQQTLEKSFSILVQSLEEAVEFSNMYAPEHLVLAVQDADALSPQIKNAGSVFLGSFSSVVFGDYASGTNHTLPTGGTAVSAGGVTVESFMKPLFFQSITEQAVKNLAVTVKSLARAEQLEAHAKAIEQREVRND